MSFKKAIVDEKTGDIITPEGRMVWPSIFEAKKIRGKGNENSPPRFTVTLLIPKNADITALQDGIRKVAVEKFGDKWKTKTLRLPLVKTEDIEQVADLADEYPYAIRAAAQAEYKPYVMGPNAQAFAGEPEDVYSGRWGRVAGNFYAYDNVSKGVAFGLNRVQVLRDDEPIASARVATASGFEAAGDEGQTADDLL